MIIPNRSNVVKNEQKILKNFFGRDFFDIPNLPDWITDEFIQYWNKNIFHIRYLPPVLFGKNLNLPLWQDKPSKFFYRKISENKLKKEAEILPGKWILIDGRDKPVKKVPWIRINDVVILQKIGFDPKKYFKKWNKQSHLNEYLKDILIKTVFGSSFCLTIDEINDLKPYILKFLKIDSSKIIRLPFFIEYNYLGNTIYKQWKTTETWEWFEDKIDDGQNLAGGSNSVGCIGWEPPQFWSTILTFRPVIEL